MQKQAPTLGRILIMAIFTLSCFGLLLYLWAAFGGPVPLKPRGYQFKASFAEATQLAQEADVRISGVTVGKVTAGAASHCAHGGCIGGPTYFPGPDWAHRSQSHGRWAL